MARLIFLVAGAGVIDVRETIEREFSVSGEARRGRLPVDFLVRFVACARGQRIDKSAAAGDLLQRRIEKARELAVRETLMKIANLPKFLFDVALLDLCLISAERFRGSVAGFERFECGFGGEHATFYRKVNAF